ncbi:MAG TPA: hypothetical protein PKN32_10045 [Bacteroidales bacterium]|nr:hypothetical protein [Bacteroidales bacterium]
MNKALITLYFALLISLPQTVFCQFFAGMGTNFGGAIPTEMTENSLAKIYPGAFIMFGNKIQITERLSFSPQISADYRWFNYYASQTKDTTVLTTVLNVPANIPTYYTANISGKIRLIGIFFETPFCFQLSEKFNASAGIYGSYNAYKSDFVEINVKIGEGGLLPDVDSSYNNKSNINNFDAGINIGGEYAINDKFVLSLGVYRSLSRFYKKNSFNNNTENDNISFYYTQLRLGFIYLFNDK